MAHAAFPLPIAHPSAFVSADARRRIRILAVPLALGITIAALSTVAIAHLEGDSDRLGSAVMTREEANRVLADDVMTAHRSRALVAERAETLRYTIADQLVTLDSREGFLP